jgi:hypothetical protein
MDRGHNGDPERPSDRTSRCLEAVIEDPAGSTVRHVYDPVIGQWRTYRHPAAVSPWPANYGYLPGTYNPSDDDALDVIVLSRDPLPTGTRLLVRQWGSCVERMVTTRSWLLPVTIQRTVLFSGSRRYRSMRSNGF